MQPIVFAKSQDLKASAGGSQGSVKLGNCRPSRVFALVGRRDKQ